MNELPVRCGGDHRPSSLITFKNSSREYLVCDDCVQLPHYSRGIKSKEPISEEMIHNV